jgi:uroporphyrin-III C-methyltransferase
MNQNDNPTPTADATTTSTTVDQPTNTPKSGTPAAADAHKRSARSSRGGAYSGGLALIVAVLALFAASYLWYTLLYQQRTLFDTDVPNALKQLQGSVSEIRQALDHGEERLKSVTETQATLAAALEKMQGNLGQNRAEWVLAETEQLLQIANHRLQLARDIKTALSALRTADRQLEKLADPKLLPVRKELSKEIHLLDSLEQTDVTGLTLRLGALADNVTRLPLILEVSSLKAPGLDKTPGTAPGTQSTDGLWQGMLNLVRIRSHAETQKPLLPPEHQYFLRENLRLMLYGAQNAMLQSDVATYQQNLKSASRLIAEYFDTNTQVVLAAQQELEKLLGTKITIDLPDISGSLSELRKLTTVKPSL